MANGSQLQPNEIQRVACSGCAGFLRLERSMPERVGHPRYDMMRCVRCEFVQWNADESLYVAPASEGARIDAIILATGGNRDVDNGAGQGRPESVGPYTNPGDRGPQ